MEEKSKINMGFWAKLKKPFFCLAPMLDVTDIAFRQTITKYSKHGKKNGGPDVFWTEFVSADGLCSAGKERLLPILNFNKKERPIVAQLFSSDPDNMRDAAKICVKLGFDGIDINMGCPDKAIIKQGSGSALIKNIKLAQEVIYATKEGAGKIPVSVKTRIGFNKNEIETWIPAILETGVAAITLHARTVKELSKVPADWKQVKRMMEIIRESGKKTLGIGNGDILSMEDAKKKAEKYGADGVMIGRGIFGNPWFFDRDKKVINPLTPLQKGGISDDFKKGETRMEEKLKVLIEHSKLFSKKCSHKNFAVMKKHFKAYVSGFDGAKELRVKLMDAKGFDGVKKIVKIFLKER